MDDKKIGDSVVDEQELNDGYSEEEAVEADEMNEDDLFEKFSDDDLALDIDEDSDIDLLSDEDIDE